MRISDKPPAVAAAVTLVRAFGVVSGTLLVAGIVIGSGVFKQAVLLANKCSTLARATQCETRAS